MPATGLTESGGTYRCPHCGALYAVMVRRLLAPRADEAVCEICLRTMTSWHSTRSIEHRLLRAPKVLGAAREEA